MNSIISSQSSNSMPLRARALVKMLERIAVGTLKVLTPEGVTLTFGNGAQPHVHIELISWKAIQRIFRQGDVGLAETYRDGGIFCDDLTSLLRLGIANQSALEKALHGNALMRLFYRFKHLLNINTRRGSKSNIQAHYDLGNDFYKLWLDKTMTYSSGLFSDIRSESMEDAQAAKYGSSGKCDPSQVKSH